MKAITIIIVIVVLIGLIIAVGVISMRTKEAPTSTTPAPTTIMTATQEVTSLTPTSTTPAEKCDPSYPDVCIPPPPPDLSCKDIPYRNFRVLPPDPHRFDVDEDGIGCET